MRLSPEVALGNGEILELRTGGENVTAHRQVKTHREALISAGDEKTSKTNFSRRYFSLSKNQPQSCGPIVSFELYNGAIVEATFYDFLSALEKNCSSQHNIIMSI